MARRVIFTDSRLVRSPKHSGISTPEIGTRNAALVLGNISRRPPKMKYLPMIFMLGTLFSIALIGCQQPIGPVVSHKLRVIGNQSAVPVFPDEESYLHTSHEKQEGGVVGMVGDVKQNLTAKQIDDQTPVQIVTSDEY